MNDCLIAERQKANAYQFISHTVVLFRHICRLIGVRRFRAHTIVMKKFDIHSDEFQRGMALHYLKQHKGDKQFQVNTSISQTTLDELKTRGCNVALESSAGLYTISLDVPFRELVTNAEWKQDRLELLQGIGLFVLTKGGYIAVIALAVTLNMGLHVLAIWVWGWVLLSSAAFPDCRTRHRPRYVMGGLALFGVGVVVRLLGL